MGTFLPDNNGLINDHGDTEFMEKSRGCADCIGYLTHNVPDEPFECPDCHNKTMCGIQLHDGTYGCRCSTCGMEIVADLNTECELDTEEYRITILKQNPDKETLIALGKIVKKNALDTLKALEEGDITLTGDLAFAWETVPELEHLGIKHTVTPDDMKTRYFYAGKCHYPYARVK